MRNKHKNIFIYMLIIFCMIFLVSCVDDDYEEDTNVNYKPVIYLYPEEETKINVVLNYNGKLICTYPESDGTWDIIANPDGTLINLEDNKEYSYLFWEGITDTDYDFSEGFVVKGEDMKDFLHEKLAYMGLTPREYNEFIVYWLPLMKDNKYNLISFQGEVYTNSAKLTITPSPESILRVFMAYKEIDELIQIREQELKPFERKGFTVVEWGGTKVSN